MFLETYLRLISLQVIAAFLNCKSKSHTQNRLTFGCLIIPTKLIGNKLKPTPKGSDLQQMFYRVQKQGEASRPQTQSHPRVKIYYLRDREEALQKEPLQQSSSKKNSLYCLSSLIQNQKKRIQDVNQKQLYLSDREHKQSSQSSISAGEQRDEVIADEKQRASRRDGCANNSEDGFKRSKAVKVRQMNDYLHQNLEFINQPSATSQSRGKGPTEAELRILKKLKRLQAGDSVRVRPRQTRTSQQTYMGKTSSNRQTLDYSSERVPAEVPSSQTPIQNNKEYLSDILREWNVFDSALHIDFSNKKVHRRGLSDASHKKQQSIKASKQNSENKSLMKEHLRTYFKNRRKSKTALEVLENRKSSQTVAVFQADQRTTPTDTRKIGNNELMPQTIQKYRNREQKRVLSLKNTAKIVQNSQKDPAKTKQGTKKQSVDLVNGPEVRLSVRAFNNYRRPDNFDWSKIAK